MKYRRGQTAKKRRCQEALASWQRYLLPARALCNDHCPPQTVADPGPIDRQPRPTGTTSSTEQFGLICDVSMTTTQMSNHPEPAFAGSSAEELRRRISLIQEFQDSIKYLLGSWAASHDQHREHHRPHQQSLQCFHGSNLVTSGPGIVSV